MNREILGGPPLDRVKVAGILAQEGETANRQYERSLSELRRQIPEPPIFYLAVAAWLKEAFSIPAANKDESFYRNLLSYMEKETGQGVIEDYARVPLFVEAATLWRIVLITQDATSLADDFSSTEIWLYQEIVLNAAGLLAIRKIPRGIGPWLFLGPFRLLAAWKPQYWGSLEFEHLLYPLAQEEVSALRFLKSQGADWLGQNLERILKVEEQNFSTASATTAMAQDIQRELASVSRSHVLHINAGLRELGASLF